MKLLLFFVEVKKSKRQVNGKLGHVAQIHVSHERNSKSLKLVQSPNFLPRDMQIREYSTQASLRITRQGKNDFTRPHVAKQLLSRDVYVVSLFCITFHSKDGNLC